LNQNLNTTKIIYMIISSKCSTNVAGEIRATSPVKSRRREPGRINHVEASEWNPCNLAGEITSPWTWPDKSHRSEPVKSVQPRRWNHVAITSSWPGRINHVGEASKGEHVGAASNGESSRSEIARHACVRSDCESVSWEAEDYYTCTQWRIQEFWKVGAPYIYIYILYLIFNSININHNCPLRFSIFWKHWMIFSFFFHFQYQQKYLFK